MDVSSMAANTESQYPHLYQRMEKIENVRMSKDMLYRVIMDPNPSALQDTVEYFVKKLKETRTQDNTANSKRMVRMMELAVKDSNRLLKHSLIFFSLQLEPWAADYFMQDNRSPPEKISKFVSGELNECVAQLLKGSYTSLQGMVEDARWRYVVL